MPVPVPPVHRQRHTGRGEVHPDRVQEVPALLIDRAHPPERVVVLGHPSEPFRRDTPAVGDVLKERQDVIGTLGSPERDKQERIVTRHANYPTRLRYPGWCPPPRVNVPGCHAHVLTGLVCHRHGRRGLS